ncbi:invasin [Salmonella enterica subsp. enterica serovar Indiana]|nr:invasin [Salmonella enterica subsp. enterica serovar Indiana]
MVFSKKPITKYITWAIVTSQISLPVIADSDSEIQSWIAGTASSISPHLQEGTLEDYAKVDWPPESPDNQYHLNK